MFALRVARVLDGRELLPGSGVVFVDGDRIVGVEPAGFPMPEGCEVLDRPAGTLPGLIDGHVHLVADSGVGPLDRLPGFVNDCRYNERTQRKNRELREGRRLSVVTPGGPLRRHRNALDDGGIGRPDPVASLMLSADRGPRERRVVPHRRQDTVTAAVLVRPDAAHAEARPPRGRSWTTRSTRT